MISLPFLRHYMYHEKKTELKVYYRRRFSRIGWPFLLSCVIFYTLYVVANRLSLAGESPHLFSAVACMCIRADLRGMGSVQSGHLEPGGGSAVLSDRAFSDRFYIFEPFRSCW